MWLFYVPVPYGEGKKLAKELMDTCRCVNIYESTSVYKWKGKVVEEPEEVMVVKTSTPFEFEKKIRAIHPHEVPAIIKIKAEANEDYERWLKT